LTPTVKLLNSKIKITKATGAKGKPQVKHGIKEREKRSKRQSVIGSGKSRNGDN